jgi:hypothetical protein
MFTEKSSVVTKRPHWTTSHGRERTSDELEELEELEAQHFFLWWRFLCFRRFLWCSSLDDEQEEEDVSCLRHPWGIFFLFVGLFF